MDRILHDDVETVDAVRVGESSEVIVRVGVVEFLDAIGDETLAAREERASQSRLVERAHASEVSDDAEALRELDGASEFSEELGEHDVRRLRASAPSARTTGTSSACAATILETKDSRSSASS